ncbi:MAG TPA: hypothetical protein VL134_02670 [Leptolyngbya sp.]|nr:hypothetical protein [Leptolyngbya sp.]
MSNLNQDQFGVVIDLNYVTISRWESDQMQLSERALWQIHAFLEQLRQFSAHPIQERGKKLLALYFAARQG